jgi:hypothetical protein
MKSKLRTALLFASALGGAFGPGCLAAGLVIYKDYSFDADSQAELTEYSSDDHYSTVDNVVTPGGQRLRILASQEPIFIPQAGDRSAKPAAMSQTIQAAEKRFPQFAARLEACRRAWAAVPASTPTPAQRLAVSPAATPAPVDTPPPAPDHGLINKTLRTKTGETLQGWRVTGMEGDTVVISDADGISRVPIGDLPDNLYGFPQVVIARAEQLRQARQDALADSAQTVSLDAPKAGRSPGSKQGGKHNAHAHKTPPPNWSADSSY